MDSRNLNQFSAETAIDAEVAVPSTVRDSPSGCSHGSAAAETGIAHACSAGSMTGEADGN
jgi:hypothetical protein